MTCDKYYVCIPSRHVVAPAIRRVGVFTLAAVGTVDTVPPSLAVDLAILAFVAGRAFTVTCLTTNIHN